ERGPLLAGYKLPWAPGTVAAYSAASVAKDDLCRAPSVGLGLHRYRMLSPLFCGKTQLQLEAHAAQNVARAVPDRDRVVRAVVKQLDGSFECLVFGQEGFDPGQTFFAALLGRTRPPVVIGDRTGHLFPPTLARPRFPHNHTPGIDLPSTGPQLRLL